MIDQHYTIVVQYPIDSVFPFFTDLRNEEYWHPDLISMEKISSGTIGQNTRFVANYKQVGTMDILITQFAENRRADFHCSSKAFTIDMQCELQEGAEGTEIRVAMQMKLQGFMRLMSPLIAYKLKKDWARKGAQIESGLEKAGAGTPRPVQRVGIEA